MMRVLWAIVAALAAMPAGAAAADQISRPPGAIDHRGYELVSLPDKDTSQIRSVSVSPTGGDRVRYDLFGGAPGSPAGFSAMFLASRTASGWTSKSYLPPRAEMLRSNYMVGALTPDLSHAIVAIVDSLGGNGDSRDVTLARLDEDGHQSLIHTFPVVFAPFGTWAVASDDLSHVLTATPEAIDASHQLGTYDVYDFGGATPALVSAMPGTGLAPQCGVPVPGGEGFATELDTVAQHWVLPDGSRAFFITQGDDCSGPRELYMRDLQADTTSLISGPPVAGDADNGVDVFLQATPDGSKVFYRTATSFDPADDTDGDANDLDIYRWSAAGGQNTCVTCGVPNAGVSASSDPNLNAVVAEDGSRLYFTSPNQLGDAPAPADDAAPNLYVQRLDGSPLHFIGRVNGISAQPGLGGQATPDGHVLIFSSNQAGLDAVGGGSNGGFMQYYRYDDRDDSVTCVSCPPGGAATSDVPLSLAQTPQGVPQHLRIVGDDGSMVFFTTSDALVPEDVNDGPDIYEWHDGRVGLITNGVTHYPSIDTAPRVDSVSPDGRDLFFEDFAQLTPDALDRAGKLYDARIDGGFEPPPPPPPPCAGDVCHGPPTGAPQLPDGGSVSLDDPGNLIPGSLAIGRVSAAQRSQLARSGRLALSVKVNGAGQVTAVARATIGKRLRRIAQASRHAAGAGTVKLALTLSRAARRQLARTGRLTVRLAVAFSGAPGPKHIVLVLR